MAEAGEDWNGLEMTILKSLANFFKIRERWRTSFNGKSGHPFRFLAVRCLRQTASVRVIIEWTTGTGDYAVILLVCLYAVNAAVCHAQINRRFNFFL